MGINDPSPSPSASFSTSSRIPPIPSGDSIVQCPPSVCRCGADPVRPIPTICLHGSKHRPPRSVADDHVWCRHICLGCPGHPGLVPATGRPGAPGPGIGMALRLCRVLRPVPPSIGSVSDVMQPVPSPSTATEPFPVVFQATSNILPSSFSSSSSNVISPSRSSFAPISLEPTSHTLPYENRLGLSKRNESVGIRGCLYLQFLGRVHQQQRLQFKPRTGIRLRCPKQRPPRGVADDPFWHRCVHLCCPGHPGQLTESGSPGTPGAGIRLALRLCGPLCSVPPQWGAIGNCLQPTIPPFFTHPSSSAPWNSSSLASLPSLGPFGALLIVNRHRRHGRFGTQLVCQQTLELHIGRVGVVLGPRGEQPIPHHLPPIG